MGHEKSTQLTTVCAIGYYEDDLIPHSYMGTLPGYFLVAHRAYDTVTIMNQLSVTVSNRFTVDRFTMPTDLSGVNPFPRNEYLA